MGLRGQTAELRAGPRLAAQLGEWSLAQPDGRMVSPGEWIGSARVLRRDAFWSSHAPLDLVVQAGEVRWVWRGVAVAWGDGVVTICGAGAPEVRT